MIDEFAIVSHGGLVLWRRTFQKVTGNPINQLIRNIVLEERMTEDGTYSLGEYRIRYILVNEFELILVVIMQKMLQLLCSRQLLEDVRDAFVTNFGPQLKSGEIKSRPGLVPTSFEAVFDKHYEKFKRDEMQMRISKGSKLLNTTDSSHSEVRTESNEVGTATGPAATPEVNAGKKAPLNIAARKGSAAAAVAAKKQTSESSTTVAKVKKARDWGGEGGSKGGSSGERQPGPPSESRPAPNMEHFVKRDAEGNIAKANPDDWGHIQDNEDVEETTTEAPVQGNNKEEAKTKRGRFSAFLRNRFGNRELDDEDLQSVLPALREKLIAKNVAVDVCDKLIASVATSLQGKRLGAFDVLTKVIQDALTSSLQRILTPKREVNIIRDAARCRDELARPYIICFCGVNGVGKSTSLSKIAFLLKQNNFSVLVAACDTFRGGAVEQLQVHCHKIGMPLYHQGYGKDASEVAKNAISQATRERINVVLVDTAGRMQDHEARMVALAKLVHENKPDLTLFVGEALVGNDGAHQLSKFNECFLNLTPPGCPPRGIDGVFLTKFDTIDDKVGAAVSMVYQCGQPIVFAGVGQTYQDLKRLNPEVIARTLMA